MKRLGYKDKGDLKGNLVGASFVAFLYGFTTC